MRKNKKVYSFFLLSLLCIIFINFIKYEIYGATHNYYNTQGQEFIRNLNLINKDNEELKKIPYSVDFIFKNNKMIFKNDILYKNNRIYISISDFIKAFNLVAEKIDDSTIKMGNDIEIDNDERVIYKNDKEISLRGDLFLRNENYYMSLFDLCEMLNLNTYWDYDNNKIYFSKKTEVKEDINDNMDSKKGYIRFEDFTAGDVYLKSGSLEKVRLITDYMKTNNESFSVSWVPRYINNDKGIDNDISEKDSMENSNFLFTLDYIVNNGGNIGLHGYTHQYNNTNSISGVEFGKEGCNNLQEVRKRVEKAITIANKLNIPISYWETPHYKTTAEEQKIFEEYFDKIYEPAIGIYNKKIIVSKNNEFTKYIPTPLSYVDDDNGEGIMERMKNLDENQEFSLFYHLSIEIKSIDISINDKGDILYKYDKNSILKNIVKLSRSLGYKFSDINDI